MFIYYFIAYQLGNVPYFASLNHYSPFYIDRSLIICDGIVGCMKLIEIVYLQKNNVVVDIQSKEKDVSAALEHNK